MGPDQKVHYRWHNFLIRNAISKLHVNQLPALLCLILGSMMMIDPAATASACPEHAFCDDFEDDEVGVEPSSPWVFERRGEPSIEVSADDAFSGRHAVKIEASGRETAFLSLEGTPFFPKAGNRLFGRAMIKLEAAPDKRVHWTILEGKGRTKDGGRIVEYRYGGAKPIEQDGQLLGSRLMANYETPKGAKTDCWHNAKKTTVMPTNRWICLAFDFDGEANRMELSIDGEALDDLTVPGVGQGCMHASDDLAWEAPIFDRINLGWETYKDDDQRTLWIDQVAIGDQPLACPGG